MTAIKHTLQRQVFLPSEERLVAVVHVTRQNKKKKASFLCAAVTTEKPIQAVVYLVKKSERSENHFKKKSSWPLRELKFLDAKDAGEDISEFDLQFDKLYKWNASSIRERNAFIQCLWKLSRRYLVQKAEFLNVPTGVLEDATQPVEGDGGADGNEAGIPGEADYQVLSTQEEEDLQSMMSQCDFAISNAEAFSEQLAKDLSVLDGANIHSIMGSEDQVQDLMVLIDQALQEADQQEQKLGVYDHKLQTVKELMEVMADKDSLLSTRATNHQHLLDTLDDLVSALDLDKRHLRALSEANFTSAHAIRACTEAANALQCSMTTHISPSLVQMTAVQEQKKRFEKYRKNFAQNLSRQLNNLFIHEGNTALQRETGDAAMFYVGELHLPEHDASHRKLEPYADLMLWLKQSDRTSFDALLKTYTQSLQKLYTRDVQEFMEAAKQKIAPRLERKGNSLQASGRRTLQRLKTRTLQARGMQPGASNSLSRGLDKRHRSGSNASIADADSVHGSDTDIANRTKFDQLLEYVLNELGPWCLSEQNFCEKFFHLSSEDDDGDTSLELPLSPDSSVLKKATPRQQQINQDVRKMMAALFPSLETELTNFIGFGDRLDNFNSLYMLVRLSVHVINAEDTGSFLSKTYALCLVHIKRNFDKFVQFQLDNMADFKIKTAKKGKAGVLPFVHAFEEFATQAENIFKGSDRRNDLDKAYYRLIEGVFEHIQRVASESHKTPSNVVKFENFHHLLGVLSRLKISSLESQRKEAKQRYQENLQAYVTLYLGRPMEKVSIFFEGVEARVAQGVKSEEIGYQLAYSKTELRKLVRDYPGKEVKKNLEHLYKKVEKHLCEEENLLQVVWVRMQDEFLKQYKHFDLLINQCYAEAGVTFEFTINDLLAYFSDIAQLH